MSERVSPRTRRTQQNDTGMTYAYTLNRQRLHHARQLLARDHGEAHDFRVERAPNDASWANDVIHWSAGRLHEQQLLINRHAHRMQHERFLTFSRCRIRLVCWRKQLSVWSLCYLDVAESAYGNHANARYSVDIAVSELLGSSRARASARAFGWLLGQQQVSLG